MFIMHRKGLIQNIVHGQNQCKTTGHDSYHFEIIIACSEDLDSKGFIIDHVDLATAVIKDSYTGSCEKMHKQIFSTVRSLFDDSDTELYAYKCTLNPTIHSDSLAWMEYLKVLTRSPRIVRQLSILF